MTQQASHQDSASTTQNGVNSNQNNKPSVATINDPSKLIDAESIRQTLQDSASLPVHWVINFDGLEACLDDLETCERVALDTEFIKRNTYYPKLALVQVNTGEKIYLIDAPKLDLTEFWVVLEEMPLMIWHACGEDLGIFYLLSECTALDNVFDTQIGLSYLTDQLQMGYQQALSEQLDVQVDKGESQSDWLARPLTEKQEHYAIDDVRYLLALYDTISRQLKKQNITDKVVADCQLYATELYEAANVEDDATYLPMADYRYTSEQLAVLQAVSSWREALARATNQPKTFIVKKQAMRELVTELPRSIKQLTQQTTIHRSTVRLYGEELMGIMNTARDLPVHERPARVPGPYRSKDKTIGKLVQQAVKDEASRISVPASVLMRKKWLANLFEVVAYDLPLDDLNEGLKGWRYDWVLNTLVPLLTEHKQAIQEGMGINGDDTST